jgi:hypothetical protein
LLECIERMSKDWLFTEQREQLVESHPLAAPARDDDRA